MQILTEYDEEASICGWRKDGRQEMAEETAIKMLKKEYPFSEISEITGLTPEQVMELQKKIPVQA